MPTYHFTCNECDSTVSHLIPLDEDIAAPKCLSCKEFMERVFSIPSIVFRGSGWGSSR